jgi:predicted nucleotidyltransferase
VNIKESQVVKEVVATLEKLYGKRLSKIFLYGSYARGTQTAESDIDFLVMLKDKNVSPFKEIDFYIEDMMRLSDKFNIEISLRAAPENFFENQNSLFPKFIKHDAVLLIEKI